MNKLDLTHGELAVLEEALDRLQYHYDKSSGIDETDRIAKIFDLKTLRHKTARLTAKSPKT